MPTGGRSLDVSSFIPSLIFNVHNIHVLSASTRILLQGTLLSKFIWGLVSIQSSSHPAAIATTIFTFMPIHTASISCFPIPPLNLLIYKNFKVLLSYESFLKL